MKYKITEIVSPDRGILELMDETGEKFLATTLDPGMQFLAGDTVTVDKLVPTGYVAMGMKLTTKI